MANGFYTNIRNLAVGNGTHTYPDYDTDTLRAVLVDAGVTALSLTTHQDENDILTAVLSSGEATLANVTAGSVGGIGVGVVDCDDIVWTTPAATSAEYITIFQDTGTATTSPLICAFDTATGLPITPTGGNVTAVVSSSGLFSF